MSDFIQSFIARLKEEKKAEKTMSMKGRDDKMSRDDKKGRDEVIRTHKDIIEMKPSKTIVREFFRQSVELMNNDKE